MSFNKSKKRFTYSKKINGKKYVAEYKGALQALKSTSFVNHVLSEPAFTENTKIIMICNYVFATFLIKPKGVKLKDFKDVEEIKEVFNLCIETGAGVFKGDKK